MLALSDLERAVLAAIAEQVLEQSATLREQVARMKVIERDNTGHGFYARLHVDGAPPLHGPSPLGNIGARVEGVEHGMGFLLWLDERGMAESLEGYAYDGDLTGLDLTRLRFSDVGPRLGS